MKKVLLLVHRAPFGSVFAAEALRAGIAFAGMDLETKLVFADDGVFCLLKDQKPELGEMTGLKEGFDNAEEFGLNIFADAESISERNLKNDSLIEVERTNLQQIRGFIDEADATINF